MPEYAGTTSSVTANPIDSSMLVDQYVVYETTVIKPNSEATQDKYR
jgi:hypothetical protein